MTDTASGPREQDTDPPAKLTDAPRTDPGAEPLDAGDESTPALPTPARGDGDETNPEAVPDTETVEDPTRPATAQPSTTQPAKEPEPEPERLDEPAEPASTEPDATPAGRGPAHGGAHAAAEPSPGGWTALARGLRPHWGWSQVLVGILCAVLGFALVVQLGQSGRGQYSSMRQSDLVRTLDEVTTRANELEDQAGELRATRDKLAREAEQQRAADKLAETQAETQGILSGRLAAEGPGVTIDIVAPSPVKASSLLNLLEELRNAGAEVIQVNNVRIVTDSYFTDINSHLEADGIALSMPLRWIAIGDPATIETALKIHAGAVDILAGDGAQTTITRHESVQITATVTPPDPQYATPTK